MGQSGLLAKQAIWWFFGGSLAAHALLISLPSPQQSVPAVVAQTGPVLQLRVREQNNVYLQAATTQTTAPSSPPQAERPRPPESESKPKSKPVMVENAPRLAEAVPPSPKALLAKPVTPGQVVEQTDTPHDEHAERKKLLAALNHELARHFHYPLQAVRRGWQGTVQLGFVVDEKGGIEHIQVLQSSGHALLDRAAIQALSKVGSLATRPRQSRSLQLPVDYRLIEG